MKKFTILLLFCISFTSLGFCQGIEERFKGLKKLTYKVYYNGMFSGYIYWSYQGKEKIGKREADVLRVSSDTKIFKLLDLTSDEEVYLDSETHLPLKVERNILMFGKKELIEEIYNQEKGYVQIVRKGDVVKEEILRQQTPIHNILALLYFFPESIKLEKDKWMIFNLPTQKIKIKFIEERMLKVGKDKQNTYFLLGRGAKRFSLWMDKTTRLPLRIEFVSILGKLSIVRVEE